MTRTLFRLPVFIAVVLFASHIAFPITITMVGPTGTEFPLGGDCLIWDVSGTYEQSIGDSTAYFTLVQDGVGKILGGGQWEQTSNGVTQAGVITAKGQIKSKAGITTMQLHLRYDGTIREGKHKTKFSVSQKYAVEIDPVNCNMNGTMDTLVSMAGHKDRGSEYVSLDFPIGMDGSSVLYFPDPLFGGGSPELRLSNGRSASFFQQETVTNGVRQILLKGAKGIAFNLTAETDYSQIISLNGKISGQIIEGALIPRRVY